MSLLPPLRSSQPLQRRASSDTESNLSDAEILSTTTTSSLPEDGDHTSPVTPGSVGIVGMACRVAGANNPSQLWDNIVQQKDLQRKMPSDRFNVDAFYNPDGANKGTVSQKALTGADSQLNMHRRMHGWAIS